MVLFLGVSIDSGFCVYLLLFSPCFVPNVKIYTIWELFCTIWDFCICFCG